MTRLPPLLASLALLVTVAHTAQAARWLHVATTPAETVVEIDADAISGRGEQVQVWVRYLFGPDAGRVVAGQVARQAVTLTRVDCATRSSGVLESGYHDASGRVLRRQAYDAPRMEPIRQGSTMEAVAEQVCG